VSRKKASSPPTRFDKGFVYVANPYSHANLEIMATRYDQVTKHVSQALLKGEVVYSPIVHHHHMALTHRMPSDWAFWRHIDGNMLASARKLRVLCLDGWERSVGVQAEIAIALALKIPVEYINE
jgi:hypothetical protein